MDISVNLVPSIKDIKEGSRPEDKEVSGLGEGMKNSIWKEES